MMDTTGSTVPETRNCPACKRLRPAAEFRPMWRLPVFVLDLVHMRPGDEGERLYCRRCAWSQSLCASLLAAMGVAALAIGGGFLLQVGWLVGTGIGLLASLFIYLRWRDFAKKSNR